MKKSVLGLATLSILTLMSCKKDDVTTLLPDAPTVETPTNYEFQRNGATSVNFSGQTTRIKMATELLTALKTNTKTEAEINAMFNHQTGVANFSTAELNSSDKSVRSKVAASLDYFSKNTTEANAIKIAFDGWITSQVNEVYPNWSNDAVAGKAGKLQQAGGGSTRYVNAKGLELNQAFAKTLIGALMTDQILNHYLSPDVLDANDNKTNNDKGILADKSNFTTMEHYWDEAYGYMYGNEINPAVPVLKADGFLNGYLLEVDNNTNFKGIAAKIHNAFKLGRAAIVAKNYTVRDQQAAIIKENISKIIAVKAVYYLQSGKAKIGSDNASAFHALSEGYGFINSLQFTRKPNSLLPYFTKAEVDNFTKQLMAENGFWSVKATTLDQISDEISARFGFTTSQAATVN